MKNKVLNYIKNLFSINCPICKKGKVKYHFSETKYIEIYKCNKCAIELL